MTWDESKEITIDAAYFGVLVGVIVLVACLLGGPQ